MWSSFANINVVPDKYYHIHSLVKYHSKQSHLYQIIFSVNINVFLDYICHKPTRGCARWIDNSFRLFLTGEMVRKVISIAVKGHFKPVWVISGLLSSSVSFWTRTHENSLCLLVSCRYWVLCCKPKRNRWQFHVAVNGCERLLLKQMLFIIPNVFAVE